MSHVEQTQITEIIKTVQIQGTEGYSQIMCYGEAKPIDKCPGCEYLPKCHKFEKVDCISFANGGTLRETVLYSAKFPTAILLK